MFFSLSESCNDTGCCESSARYLGEGMFVVWGFFFCRLCCCDNWERPFRVSLEKMKYNMRKQPQNCIFYFRVYLVIILVTFSEEKYYVCS